MLDAPTQKMNFTRSSRSIPHRLVREGAPHLLPLYYLLRLSDLAREGIDHSGSHRFADHIYCGTPSGRLVVGRWLDAYLLSMPAATAFRRRCEHVQHVVRRALESVPVGRPHLRVLAVPCGIPRDVLDLALTIRRERPGLLRRLEYHGLDFDGEVLDLAHAMTEDLLASAHFHNGNALVRADYPKEKCHVVVSTGLGEFLQDEELAAFYTIVYDQLEPGGTFCTSATARDARSEALLRIGELVTHYRQAEDVERLLRRLPWTHLDVTVDPTGLQTFVTARR
jgi:SAM-dependent methyltransferase